MLQGVGPLFQLVYALYAKTIKQWARIKSVNWVNVYPYGITTSSLEPRRGSQGQHTAHRVLISISPQEEKEMTRCTRNKDAHLHFKKSANATQKKSRKTKLTMTGKGPAC